MRRSVREVFARLKAEGLATADQETRARIALSEDGEEEMPWYLRVAVGLGAWIATGFFLGFLFALFDFRGQAIQIVLGALLVALGVLVRVRSKADFLQHAAVASSFAGQGLIIFTIGERFHSSKSAAAAALALSLLLVRLMPDRLHRYVSAVAGAAALVVLAITLKIPHGFAIATLTVVALTGYVWRGGMRSRDEHLAEMVEPVGYGLAIALFGILLWSSFTGLSGLQRQVVPDIRMATLGPLTTAGITFALLALVWKIVDEHGAPHGSRASVAALAGVAALGFGAWSSPGLVAGIAVLILAFDRRDVVLLGLAVLYLLVFGSVYYYSLELTLLQKSGVLVGSGLLLLGIRSRVAPGDAEDLAVR